MQSTRDRKKQNNQTSQVQERKMTRSYKRKLDLQEENENNSKKNENKNNNTNKVQTKKKKPIQNKKQQKKQQEKDKLKQSQQQKIISESSKTKEDFTHKMPDGIYTGELYRQQKKGRGTFLKNNGDYFIGEFKSNKKNGLGIEIIQQNQSIYKGNFKVDQKSGSGVFVFHIKIKLQSKEQIANNNELTFDQQAILWQEILNNLNNESQTQVNLQKQKPSKQTKENQQQNLEQQQYKIVVKGEWNRDKLNQNIIIQIFKQKQQKILELNSSSEKNIVQKLDDEEEEEKQQQENFEQENIQQQDYNTQQKNQQKMHQKLKDLDITILNLNQNNFWNFQQQKKSNQQNLKPKNTRKVKQQQNNNSNNNNLASNNSQITKEEAEISAFQEQYKILKQIEHDEQIVKFEEQLIQEQDKWEFYIQFKGQFEKGMMTGQGQMILKNNYDFQRYAGYWRGNQLQQGEHTQQNGDQFMGEFNNQRQYTGNGKLLKADKSCIYIGNFQKGKKEGFGTMIYGSSHPENIENGISKFQGNWKNDLKEGLGLILKRNNQIEQCIWSQGVLQYSIPEEDESQNRSRLTQEEIDTIPIKKYIKVNKTKQIEQMDEEEEEEEEQKTFEEKNEDIIINCDITQTNDTKFLNNEELDEEQNNNQNKSQNNENTVKKEQFGIEDEEEINENMCSICYNDMEETQEVRYLNCTHVFHVYCIDKWLLMKNTCPICKKDQKPPRQFNINNGIGGGFKQFIIL